MNDPLTLWLALKPSLDKDSILNCLEEDRRERVLEELASLEAEKALDEWKAARRRSLRPVWVQSRDRLQAVPARLHPLLWPVLADLALVEPEGTRTERRHT